MSFTLNDFVAFFWRQNVEETGKTADADDDWRIVLGVFLRLFQIFDGGHVALENHAALVKDGLENGVESFALRKRGIEVPHACRAAVDARIVQRKI